MADGGVRRACTAREHAAASKRNSSGRAPDARFGPSFGPDGVRVARSEGLLGPLPAGAAGRLVEQQTEERSFREPQQERHRKPEQQCRISGCQYGPRPELPRSWAQEACPGPSRAEHDERSAPAWGWRGTAAPVLDSASRQAPPFSVGGSLALLPGPAQSPRRSHPMGAPQSFPLPFQPIVLGISTTAAIG